MAQKVLIQLVDDLTGSASDDISTVTFGLDGANYEIDLTTDNAERLRTTLTDYVTAARRTGGRIKRGNHVSNGDNGDTGTPDPGKVREWANKNGFDVSNRGRIPRHVLEAHTQAQNETNNGARNGTRNAEKTPAKRRSRTKKS
jgi:hypothetical protein